MKQIILTIGLLLTFVCLVQAEEIQKADFQAEVFNFNAESREADLKIISVSDNSFGLVVGDLIHVNFAKGADVTTFESEDIIDGKLNFWQAEVNKETVDWYMVTQCQLVKRPMLDERGMKLVGLSLAFVVIAGLFVWEKVRRWKNK